MLMKIKYNAMSQNLEMAVLQIDVNDVRSTVHTISFLIYHALRLLEGIFC